MAFGQLLRTLLRSGDRYPRPTIKMIFVLKRKREREIYKSKQVTNKHISRNVSAGTSRFHHTLCTKSDDKKNKSAVLQQHAWKINILCNLMVLCWPISFEKPVASSHLRAIKETFSTYSCKSSLMKRVSSHIFSSLLFSKYWGGGRKIHSHRDRQRDFWLFKPLYKTKVEKCILKTWNTCQQQKYLLIRDWIPFPSNTLHEVTY